MTNLTKYDQYYTSSDVAKLCFSNFSTLYGTNYYFCEPSSGDGAFYNLLPPGSRIGFDIDIPKNIDGNEIICADFLKIDNNTYFENKSNVVAIGNPPFGKNSSLAIKFINKCVEFANIIAFIVPKTFKKLSVVKKLNKYLHLVHEFELPNNAFIADGVPYDVPCVYQIWERKDSVRNDIILPLAHQDIQFVSKNTANIAFRRVGVKAGTIYTEFEKYAEASHYFIKCNLETIKLLKTINWHNIMNNTAGNPSISKRELIAEYSAISSK